jgi:hypothetical protein
MNRHDWIIMAAIGAVLGGFFRGIGTGKPQASIATAGICGAYEVGQWRVSKPAAELDDFAGCAIGGAIAAFVIPGAPKERPAGVVIDAELNRIRRAIATECDSVKRGTKTLPDSMRAFAASVCR